jgi:hypothetical protein
MRFLVGEPASETDETYLLLQLVELCFVFFRFFIIGVCHQVWWDHSLDKPKYC